MDSAEFTPVLRKLAARLGERFRGAHSFQGEQTAIIAREAWLEAARFLKEDPELDFNLLIDLTVVDRLSLGESPRFEVVAHLYSIAKNHRLRLKTLLTEEEPEIETLTGLWGNANWLEREGYDMFGIRFRGHPDLKRILLYEEFEGHALRKDYPLRRQQPLLALREVQEPRSMVSEPLRFPAEPEFKTFPK